MCMLPEDGEVYWRSYYRTLCSEKRTRLSERVLMLMESITHCPGQCNPAAGPADVIVYIDG